MEGIFFSRRAKRKNERKERKKKKKRKRKKKKAGICLGRAFLLTTRRLHSG